MSNTEPVTEEMVVVSTLMSASEKKGRVQMEGPEIRAQMDVGDARALAWNLLSAAAMAEADAFIWHFALEMLKGDEGLASMMMIEFRKYREATIATPPEGVPLVGPDGPINAPEAAP